MGVGGYVMEVPRALPVGLYEPALEQEDGFSKFNGLTPHLRNYKCN